MKQISLEEYQKEYFLENLRKNIYERFSFSPNKNQLKELLRLFYEISKREDKTFKEVFFNLKVKDIEKAGGRNKFFLIKQSLIKRRFPLTFKEQKIDTKSVYLPPLKKPLANNIRGTSQIEPSEIFIEEEAGDYPLAKRVKDIFPNSKISYLKHHRQYLKNNRFKLENLKKQVLFIIKERWDFIKPCPCTRNNVNCGYWVFNLGFGCPFDCSYCFLQTYANFEGIILPANIEDFFKKCDEFLKEIKGPLRVGTGEFCDSLALDNITQYSKDLIGYFGKKENIILELKTKSNQIDNLLKISPPANIVISFSLNPDNIAKDEELGAASNFQRIEAAKILKSYGYKLGFHFDPIIYYQTWEKDYSGLIEHLYSKIKPPFAWISLGALRGYRNLKQCTEQRFPESKIFEGELFLGEDKKLRYPLFIRKEIFKKMNTFIRNYDKKTPLYLCMEPADLWKVLTPPLLCPGKV